MFTWLGRSGRWVGWINHLYRKPKKNYFIAKRRIE